MTPCAVCGEPLDRVAHDFHGEDCTWDETECCRCDGLVHPDCCPTCLREKEQTMGGEDVRDRGFVAFVAALTVGAVVVFAGFLIVARSLGDHEIRYVDVTPQTVAPAVIYEGDK